MGLSALSAECIQEHSRYGADALEQFLDQLPIQLAALLRAGPKPNTLTGELEDLFEVGALRRFRSGGILLRRIHTWKE